jgi:HSP20 family protein
MSEKHPLQPAPTSGALVPVRQPSRVTFTPRVDVVETADEVLLLADVPGVRPEDLELHFEKDELTLHGRCAPRGFGTRTRAAEYEVGDFYRTFAVGEGVDSGRITAELAHGVLTLRLPKREAVKPKRIPVQGA